MKEAQTLESFHQDLADSVGGFLVVMKFLTFKDFCKDF